MQVCPLQQDFTTEPVNDKIKESSDLIPPRILQSVHGFFNLKTDHPTRLNLCASWDKNTVSNTLVESASLLLKTLIFLYLTLV